MATRAAAWRTWRTAARRPSNSNLYSLRWRPFPSQQQWMSTSTAATLDLHPLLLIPKPGTGFDNFIPKKDKKPVVEKEEGVSSEKKESAGTKESKENKSSESKKSKSSETKNGKESGGDSFNKDEWGHFGGGGGNNDNLLWSMVAVMAVFAAVTMLDQASDNPDHQVVSREMTWPQLHALLDKNEVEKLVVTRDASWARVFLKPGSAGVPTSHRAMYSTATAEHEQDMHNDVDVVEGLEQTTNTTNTSSLGKHAHQLVYRFAIGSVDTLEHKLEDAQLAMGRDYKNHVPIQYAPDSTVATELLGILPYVVVYGILFFVMRNSMRAGGAGGAGGGIFQIGKSTAKKINKQDINVTFKDVAGCDEAKREIMEFVDFLQDPTRFTKLGAKIPKGALLCGPPGTGKTLLAKATAGESGVPFYSISGSDFIEMFVGVGPSRVRDLFKEARENAPCIIFIDEIDAVGRQRGRGGLGGNDERENTLNQLLVEMDGFNPSAGVVVLAGTNRVDILDQALTRPGRFDRQITVDKPDLNGRKQIFMVHLDGLVLEEDAVEIAGRLAGLTPGFAGADIANLCNEAAIVAARRKAESVSMDDFEKATDRIVGGLESNKIMSKDERSIVAHHEAGHAIAGWFLEHADPLLKVTIIPRSSGALGYAQYLPKEVFLRTQDQIMDIVCMALAGRAAEEIFFGGVTTGASDDLRRVTDLVYSTIQVYGMNSRLGQLAFPKDPNAMFEDRPYSDATAKAMDEEAKSIVDTAYMRTLDLLREKKDEVENLAALLLEKETITHDDMVDLLGERPYQGDPAYNEFIRRKMKTGGERKANGEEVMVDDEQDGAKGQADASGLLNPLG